MKSSFVILSIAALLAGPALAGGSETDHGSHVSPYAGEEARTIKSLSAEDVDDLMNGRGWGLAKAAELNGMPGPAHILEMREDIALTPEQAERIETIRQAMQAEAIRVGARLVDLERDLDTAFASGDVDAKTLRAMVAEIEAVRGELRYVHLAAHLETPEILTPHQVATYNRLRGYGVGDPCANPPAGHDAEMWRKHNNCE